MSSQIISNSKSMSILAPTAEENLNDRSEDSPESYFTKSRNSQRTEHSPRLKLHHLPRRTASPATDNNSGHVTKATDNTSSNSPEKSGNIAYRSPLRRKKGNSTSPKENDKEPREELPSKVQDKSTDSAHSNTPKRKPNKLTKSPKSHSKRSSDRSTTDKESSDTPSSTTQDPKIVRAQLAEKSVATPGKDSRFERHLAKQIRKIRDPQSTSPTSRRRKPHIKIAQPSELVPEGIVSGLIRRIAASEPSHPSALSVPQPRRVSRTSYGDTPKRAWQNLQHAVNRDPLPRVSHEEDEASLAELARVLKSEEEYLEEKLSPVKEDQDLPDGSQEDAEIIPEYAQSTGFIERSSEGHIPFSRADGVTGDLQEFPFPAFLEAVTSREATSKDQNPPMNATDRGHASEVGNVTGYEGAPKIGDAALAQLDDAVEKENPVSETHDQGLAVPNSHGRLPISLSSQVVNAQIILGSVHPVLGDDCLQNEGMIFDDPTLSHPSEIIQDTSRRPRASFSGQRAILHKSPVSIQPEVGEDQMGARDVKPESQNCSPLTTTAIQIPPNLAPAPLFDGSAIPSASSRSVQPISPTQVDERRTITSPSKPEAVNDSKGGFLKRFSIGRPRGNSVKALAARFNKSESGSTPTSSPTKSPAKSRASNIPTPTRYSAKPTDPNTPLPIGTSAGPETPKEEDSRARRGSIIAPYTTNTPSSFKSQRSGRSDGVASSHAVNEISPSKSQKSDRSDYNRVHSSTKPQRSRRSDNAVAHPPLNNSSFSRSQISSHSDRKIQSNQIESQTDYQGRLENKSITIELKSSPTKHPSPRRILKTSLNDFTPLRHVERSFESIRRKSSNIGNAANPFTVSLKSVRPVPPSTESPRKQPTECRQCSSEDPAFPQNYGTTLPAPDPPPVAQHIHFSQPSARRTSTHSSFEDPFASPTIITQSRSTSLGRTNSVLHERVRSLQNQLVKKDDEIRQLKRQLDMKNNRDSGTLSEKLRESNRELQMWKGRAECAEKQVELLTKISSLSRKSSRHTARGRQSTDTLPKMHMQHSTDEHDDGSRTTESTRRGQHGVDGAASLQWTSEASNETVLRNIRPVVVTGSEYSDWQEHKSDTSDSGSLHELE